MQEVSVYLLPQRVEPRALADHTAVVIDVLRATTTMVYALAAGARQVLPCLTIDDALRQAAALPREAVVLGGERGGLPIAGFDLGNSPGEYTPQTIAGKTVVMTTTNGTRALLHCAAASPNFVAAFANVSAVLSAIESDRPLAIVCAGTDGEPSDDDTLLAGLMAARLAAAGWKLDREAQLARDLWHESLQVTTGQAQESHLVERLRASRGGQNLIRVGLDRDIATAAVIDRHPIVPRFDPTTGLVTVWTARNSAG